MFNKIINLSFKSKRTVIIHRHLFKNAGTTFDGILEKNFGEAFCDHREDIPMRQAGPQYLIRYLVENPHIKALSSHHIWFNMPLHPNIELIPVVFLRHPIERMRSVYDFERKQNADTLGAKMAKQLNFSEYALWYMQDDKPATIRNFHARHLAGIKTAKPLTKGNFRRAVEEIQKNPLVGVIDFFDRSLHIFDKVFRSKGINLDFSWQAKNVSRPFENADYELRAREVVEELGEVAQVVLENNAFDLELYKLAKKKILTNSKTG